MRTLLILCLATLSSSCIWNQSWDPDQHDNEALVRVVATTALPEAWAEAADTAEPLEASMTELRSVPPR